MINIYVQRTLAKACSDAPITSGSVGLTAQFLFSEEWNKLTKKAIFETDNYKEPVDVPASGEVIVPESVLVYPWTQLRVGVRGESEDGYVVIPTVYADCGTISLGANTTPVGTPPTPSQAEYLQAQIDELRESGIGGGTTIELDTTLTQSGKAADAKAVGDALENVGGKAYVQDTEPAQMEVGEFWYNPEEEADSFPTTLPNPHKLTFSGAVNAEYDGSEAVEVVIPQGGGGGSEEWELIESVILSEDVSIYTKTGINLKKAYVTMHVLGTTANTDGGNGTFTVNSVGETYKNVLFAPGVMQTDGKQRWATCFMEVLCNKLRHISSTNNNNSHTSTGVLVGWLDGIASITAINVHGGLRKFGAGSVFTIYGVRA